MQNELKAHNMRVIRLAISLGVLHVALGIQPVSGAESGPSSFDLLSTLGGSINAVCVQGNVAYIGEGKHVTTLHLGPEGEVTVRDRLRLDDVVWNIAVWGNVMAVAHGDVSILNIGNPESPYLLTTINTPGNAVRLALDRYRLLVADRGNGVLFYDLTAPNHPDLTATYSTPYIDAVGIRIDIAVIALTPESLDDAVKVFDISNLHNPNVIGSIGYLNLKSGMGTAKEVKPENRGGREKIGNEESTSQRAVKGDFLYPQPVLYDLKINNSIAYLADSTYKFYSIDISNPASPSVLGRYSVEPSNSLRIAVNGQYAYLLSQPSQLEILNIENPSSPVLEDTINLDVEDPQDLSVSSQFLFVANGGKKDLSLYDISSATTPVIAGQYATIGTAVCFDVEYPIALACNGITVNHLIDLSDPELPIPLVPNLPGCCGSISEALAYTVDLISGFTILDISNPLSPSILGEVPGATGYRVVHSGTDAYVLGEAPDIRVVNVGNSTQPREVGSYDSPAISYDLFVQGDLAYLLSRSFGGQGINGLQILDCEDSSNLRLLGKYETAAYPSGISVAGSIAYVVVKDEGLLVLDVSDATNPRLLSKYTNSGNEYYDIFIDKFLGFISGDFGLEALDLRDPRNVKRLSSFESTEEFRKVEISQSIITTSVHSVSNDHYDTGGMAVFVYTGEIPATLTPSPTSFTPTLTATLTITPLSTPTSALTTRSADLDQNGIVNAMDLLIFIRDWKKQTTP